MSVETEQAVTDALHQISGWYGPGRADGTSAVGDVPTVDQPETGRSPSDQEAGVRSRLALVAALVVIAVGATALALLASPDGQEPAGLGGGLDRATIVDRCLDVETGYQLDDLATDGTVHLLGDPASGPVPLILSSGALHVVCALDQRDDGAWFQVVSLPGSHVPLGSADALNILVAVQLEEQTHIVGQAGPDIGGIEVERADGVHAARLVEGWWGVSFDGTDDQDGSFPPFSARWTTAAGVETAAGVDLLGSTPFSLCAGDATCRERRLVELRELAEGRDDAGQAAILADGVVTEGEYRSALRAWGDCIAESAGVEVTFDDGGLFTIHDTGDGITAVFARCKERHIALVVEAHALGAAAD